MAAQVKFGTRGNAYEICIRPLKDRGDYEDLQVSVKSLVNVFEHESQDEDDEESDADSENLTRTINVSVRKKQSGNTLAGLPDLVICSQYDDDDESKACSSDSQDTCDHDTTITDLDVASDLISECDEKECMLFEALKDMYEKPRGARRGKSGHRIRLPKSVSRSKSFQEQVEEMFSPFSLSNRVNAESSMVYSTEESSSDHSSPKLLPVTVEKTHRPLHARKYSSEVVNIVLDKPSSPVEKWPPKSMVHSLDKHGLGNLLTVPQDHRAREVTSQPITKHEQYQQIPGFNGRLFPFFLQRQQLQPPTDNVLPQ